MRVRRRIGSDDEARVAVPAHELGVRALESGEGLATSVSGSLRNWRRGGHEEFSYQNVYDPGSMTAPPPTKIIAVHVNYRSRAEQRGLSPRGALLLPQAGVLARRTAAIRWCARAAPSCSASRARSRAIIGRRARHVTPAEGVEHVGWFAPANDVGLYDMRWADRGSNLFSKGQDGFTPIGHAGRRRELVDPDAPDAAHARQRQRSSRRTRART